MSPGGVRVGTPALTSRGFKEQDFEQVAEFLHRAVQIAVKTQADAGSKKLKDWLPVLEASPLIAELRTDVNAFAQKYRMPGFDVSSF